MIYDKDIREPLFDLLEEKYGKSRILEEKQIGGARADAVMITESAIYGIEIKSDADTYTRLARQVAYYDMYYDYNYVVVGGTHGSHISEHVPDYWGIITVEEGDDGLDFYFLREPKVNPKLNWNNKIEILWRLELAHIQELNDMPAYKQKSKKFVSDKIIERVPHDILQQQFLAELFERDYDTIAERINEYRISNGQKARRKRKYKRKRKKKI
ncbi:MAG: sce7726 family protein [Lachnospiraceae bacterium]|nr:sce7726 family protein [Lachnospiraceae bacterium]